MAKAYINRNSHWCSTISRFPKCNRFRLETLANSVRLLKVILSHQANSVTWILVIRIYIRIFKCSMAFRIPRVIATINERVMCACSPVCDIHPIVTSLVSRYRKLTYVEDMSAIVVISFVRPSHILYYRDSHPFQYLAGKIHCGYKPGGLRPIPPTNGLRKWLKWGCSGE